MASQITQIAETANSRNYVYDTVDRLTSASYTAQPNESYSYDAVGNRTSSHLSSTYSHQLDPDTGLVYYRARWYDPQSGRFISEDPIGFDGGDVNLYGYVGNSPVDRTDATGLAWLHYWRARVWRDRNGQVVDKSPYGHISLQLDDGTYISYWPGAHVGSKDFGRCVRPFPNRSYVDDYYGEHETDS